MLGLSRPIRVIAADEDKEREGFNNFATPGFSDAFKQAFEILVK
jgi:hypothetical protein